MSCPDCLPRLWFPRQRPRRWWRAVALAGALVHAACRSSQEVDAPPPLVVDDPTDSLTAIAPSIIDSEVRYDLDPVIASLERAVPSTFGDITRKLPVENNRRAHFAFAASRSPFRISFDRERATITSDVEYEGRGWYNAPLAPEVSAACGTGGVPRPRMRVRLVSTLALTKEWELRARTRDVDSYPPEKVTVHLIRTASGDVVTAFVWENGWCAMRGSPCDSRQKLSVYEASGQVAGLVLRSIRP